jgi:hypothetical protein
MRRRVPPADFSHAEPPSDVVRFATRRSSPQWAADDFAAWLRARAAWRDTHVEPLPSLPSRERFALTQMDDLPGALVEAERAAPKAEPEWAERAQVRRSSARGGIGPLPQTPAPARPSETAPTGWASGAPPLRR